MTTENHYEVEFRFSDGREETGVFIIEDMPERVCKLILELDGEVISAEEWNYFAAMQTLRSVLEPKGIYPVCYGASRNVYPSGMSADMGKGLRAYKTYLGQPGRREDMVSIFDSGDDVEPASVEEQKAFRKKWGESLRDN